MRGTTILCPNCELQKWYPFDQLGRQPFRCDGCFEQMPIPLKIDVTQWSYKVNELIAKAFEQGVIPHLLTIVASTSPGLAEAKTLGFHPGVVLRADSGKALRDVELREIEVDFAEIFDGRLIIGECKVNGDELDEPTLQRYMKLGHLLGCSRVLFSSITTFGDEARARIQKAAAKAGRPVVEIINCEEIVDRTMAERMRADAPERDAKEAARSYLDNLARNYLVSDARVI